MLNLCRQCASKKKCQPRDKDRYIKVQNDKTSSSFRKNNYPSFHLSGLKMKNTRFVHALLAICAATEIAAFAPRPTRTIRSGMTLSVGANDDSVSGEASNTRKQSLVDRRSAMFAAFAAAAVAIPSPALAVKAKNEALCGTGFFEHIYEYKCTAIGDIEDEGYSKSLSQDETGLTDSLMGKLGVDSGDAFGDFDSSSSKSKSKSGSDDKAKKSNDDNGGQ